MISILRNKNLVILWLLALGLFMSYSLDAQKNGDIAFFAGGSYYLGEINHTRQFAKTEPAFGIFYRQSFDLRYSLRFNLYKGTLKGSDARSDYDFNVARNHSFSMDYIDIGSMVEFNFLPYITTHAKFKFAPYVTTGLSYMVSFDKQVPSSMSFPFGLGFKFAISDRISAGLEWVMHNSFSDDIDGLGDYTNNPLSEQFLNNSSAETYRQFSTIYRNDMYILSGFFISYKFAYHRFKCPAYGEPKMYE